MRWFGDAVVRRCGWSGDGIDNFGKIIFTGVAFVKRSTIIDGWTFAIFKHLKGRKNETVLGK